MPNKRKKAHFVPIQLDKTPGAASLNGQIAGALREALGDGRLRPGERLPPARALAARLGVKPVTVVTAYRHLAAEGRVESRPGRGTLVCPQLARAALPAGAGAGGRSQAPSGAGQPFPMDRLRRIMDQILTAEGAAAFGYDDPAGYPPLLETLRGYLVARGFAGVTPERLVIFSGAQQGLSVITQALVRRGDWVLVERPTYPGFLRLLQRAGAQVEAVDVGPDGPDLRTCERLFRTRPFRLFYAMPAYQNPTGACYPRPALRRLLALCARHGVTLVEDDTVADLDFGSGRPACFRQQPGAASADVLYLKSLSQLLLPGLRLGFCLAPPATAGVLRQVKQEADLSTSGFFQRVLHLFLGEDGFAEHLRELERAERRRFRAMLEAARAVLAPAGFRWAEPRGGVRLWLRLPEAVAGAAGQERFFVACARAGLPVRPGAEFATEGGVMLAGCCCFNGAGLTVAAFPALFRDLAHAAGGRN